MFGHQPHQVRRSRDGQSCPGSSTRLAWRTGYLIAAETGLGDSVIAADPSLLGRTMHGQRITCLKPLLKWSLPSYDLMLDVKSSQVSTPKNLAMVIDKPRRRYRNLLNLNKYKAMHSRTYWRYGFTFPYYRCRGKCLRPQNSLLPFKIPVQDRILSWRKNII